MNPLSPDIVSVLARDVYDVRLSDDTTMVGASVGEWRDSFNPPSRITGTSGALLRSRTGFGIVATGKGQRSGEALIAVRGTASLADGVTDAHCGIQSGPSGTAVHAGFNQTFKSLKGQLDDFFNHAGNSSIRRVHCVGHSLGGALATLVADYCRERRLDASLYTFGSPRVGFYPFTSNLTRSLGQEKIYRVYHNNDPVSMVPLFPFVHVPASGQVIMLPGNYSAYDFASHSMQNYVSDVSGTQWRSLKVAATNWLDRLDAEVRRWLDSGDRSTLAKYSGNVTWFLSKALLYVIKLALGLFGIGMQTLITTGFTLLDTLVWLLERAAGISAEIGGFLGRILSTLLSMLGRVVSGTVQITATVLRFVIQFLFTTLASQVNRAINWVHSR